MAGSEKRNIQYAVGLFGPGIPTNGLHLPLNASAPADACSTISLKAPPPSPSYGFAVLANDSNCDFITKALHAAAAGKSSRIPWTRQLPFVSSLSPTRFPDFQHSQSCTPRSSTSHCSRRRGRAIVLHDGIWGDAAHNPICVSWGHR